VRNEIELGAVHRSVKASFTEASEASGVSRTRLVYAFRGAARLSDTEKTALESFYVRRAAEIAGALDRALSGCNGLVGVDD
jgi:hypothetical protein